MINLITGYNNTGKTTWIDKETDNVIRPVRYTYPENDLHPSLHSKIIEDVIELQNNNFNIYIETHSEHILNAIRIAVAEQRLNVSNVNILFFFKLDIYVKKN